MRNKLLGLVKKYLEKNIDDMEMIAMSEEEIYGHIRFLFRNKFYYFLHIEENKLSSEDAIKFHKEFYDEIKEIILDMLS